MTFRNLEAPFGRALLAIVFMAPAMSAQTFDSAKLDAIAAEAMRAWKVPGTAVAIIQDDRVVVSKGYGVKRIGTNDPVTKDTIFAIGSATKAFTSCAVAMLMDDGKMQWDDPVRKHVPFFRLSDPMANELVTLRDLLSHRTGLSRHDLLWVNSPLTQEEIIEHIGSVPLSKPFRTAYQYQNIMFLTAGYAVGQASGGTWQEFVQKRILNPLGMTNSDLTTSAAEKSPNHSSPHGPGKDGSLGVIPWRNIDNIAPAGAVNASVEDMTKWVRLQLNDGVFEGKRLVSERNLHETHTPQTVIRPEDAGRSYNPDTHQTAYGLGWFVQDYHGVGLVEHGGAIDGFRSNITLVPEKKLGIVVLSNLNQENMPEALRWSILDLVLGFEPRDWNALLIERGRKEREDGQKARKELEATRRPNTKPTHDLAGYAGTYRNAGYGAVSIAAGPNGLQAGWLNNQSPLEHFHFDTFLCKTGALDGQPVQFNLNPRGEIVSLDLVNMNFRKEKLQ